MANGQIPAGVQREFMAVLWAILGMLGFIANLIPKHWKPKILGSFSILIAIVYFAISFKRKKKNESELDG